MITIVDYGMGNLRSVQKAVEYLNEDAEISNKKESLENADKIILPGVGAFGQAMDNLTSLGLTDVLTKEVVKKKKPFLGICLGMQLIFDKGHEMGEFRGLGWVPGEVTKMDKGGEDLKIPHVGWDEVKIVKESPLFKGTKDKTAFYFVHSYAVQEIGADVSGTCEYGTEFVAVVQKENIFATQFHPEKSQKDGLKVLKNFLELRDESL